MRNWHDTTPIQRVMTKNQDAVILRCGDQCVGKPFFLSIGTRFCATSGNWNVCCIQADDSQILIRKISVAITGCGATHDGDTIIIIFSNILIQFFQCKRNTVLTVAVTQTIMIAYSSKLYKTAKRLINILINMLKMLSPFGKSCCTAASGIVAQKRGEIKR